MRPLLAVTVLVAIVAISVAIKDHFWPTQVKPAATTATATDNAPVTPPKKTTPAKTKRTRRSATEPKARATASADAGYGDGPGVEELARAEANGMNADATNAENAQPDSEEVRSAGAHNRRVRNKIESATSCINGSLSLPNVTKPGDVDAIYYLNWAREYSCLL